ncbi:signal recognition particle-docking protein FtsY [Chloroflexota bacterium]
MGLFNRNNLDEEVWEELEEILIGADVGVATTTRILDRVKEESARNSAADGGVALKVLAQAMTDILDLPPAPKPNGAQPPHVTLVVGVNGAGKTTTIAKLAAMRKKEGKSLLIAAADTFRAAAIDQLKKQGERIGVEVIAHQPGADPGAVVYDTMEAARRRGVDEVIIDTAGRLHTKTNLMEELKKIKRVAARDDATAPHETILVLDATTGQNGLAQARYFAEAVDVSHIVLAKLDGSAKGGVVLSVCDELKIPISFIGVGEKLEDLVPFDAAGFVGALTLGEGEQ